MKIKLSGNNFSGTMTTEMSIKLEEIAIRGDAGGGPWWHFDGQVSERLKVVRDFQETLK